MFFSHKILLIFTHLSLRFHIFAISFLNLGPVMERSHTMKQFIILSQKYDGTPADSLLKMIPAVLEISYFKFKRHITEIRHTNGICEGGSRWKCILEVYKWPQKYEMDYIRFHVSPYQIKITPSTIIFKITLQLNFLSLRYPFFMM